jgi:hypothetical protein
MTHAPDPAGRYHHVSRIITIIIAIIAIILIIILILLLTDSPPGSERDDGADPLPHGLGHGRRHLTPRRVVVGAV